MESNTANQNQNNALDFRDAFRGTFYGVLRWPQLDALWETLRQDATGDWYLYAVGAEPPTETIVADKLLEFIGEIDVLLRKEHGEDYCGIVYTDSFEQPTFVKIFDPHNLGVSCGFSDNPPLPGWVMSRLPPVTLESRDQRPEGRKRWWRRLWD